MRFLNNKLPQAKFDNKAKKTVGFATKKEIEAEDDGFVGCVLENNVSSFWDTQEEALAMTQEALKLWIESQMRFRLEKLSHIMNKQSEGIYKVAI